jgi:hypothetical protein
MIERRIGGDASRPSREIAIGTEACPCLMNAPKCFHGQILGDAGVTDDTNDPAVNLFLVLVKQRLEGFQVPSREAFQKFHAPLSIGSTTAAWRRLQKARGIRENENVRSVKRPSQPAFELVHLAVVGALGPVHHIARGSRQWIGSAWCRLSDNDQKNFYVVASTIQSCADQFDVPASTNPL